MEGWVPTAALNLTNKLITRREEADIAKKEAIIFWHRSRDASPLALVLLV